MAINMKQVTLIALWCCCLRHCGCTPWSSNILRLLPFMTEVYANSSWNTVWTYETLLLKDRPDNGTLVHRHVESGKFIKCVL
jgi:hypothetical protein